MTGENVRLELKHVHREVDRHGKVRWYFRRRRGPRIALPEPGAEGFMAAYEAAQGSQKASPRSSASIQPGTLRWLCVRYFESAEFKGLDPKTRATKRGILEHCLREPLEPGSDTTFEAFPLHRLTAKAIKVLRDRKAGLPHAQNGRLKVLRRLFSWAIEDGSMAVNPARDVRRIKTPRGGHHSWIVEEVLQYEKRHPIGTKARLALGLLLFTGQRRSDVVLFGKQHVKQAWLKFTQVKNRNTDPVTLELPVLPQLESLLEQSPVGDLTFLVTEYGNPFSANGFGNKFREWCDEAGLKHCSAHGLRKAGATIAAENGATEYQLMAIFGWKTAQQAAHYVRAARQKKMAGEAMPLILRNEGEK